MSGEIKPTNEAAKEFKLLAEARGNIYRVLSSIFLKVPSKELVKGVLDERFLVALSNVVGEFHYVLLLRQFATDFWTGSVDLEALIQEYQNLFVIPGDQYVAPYESAYNEKEGRKVPNQGKPTIKETFAEAGVEISEDYRDQPDHMGLELEFMSILCFKEVEAWETDWETAIGLLEKQAAFLSKYIDQWVGSFCDNVIGLSRLTFYKGVAEMTKAFIKQDLKELQGLLVDARNLKKEKL